MWTEFWRTSGRRPPARAVAEMARVVKPGGWICALEWEADTLVMYPPCPNVLAVWQAIYRFEVSTGIVPPERRRGDGELHRDA